jgi:uncharacterized Zn-binding protein involved in type VI secretion
MAQCSDTEQQGHAGQGGAVAGSPDVLVNGRAALRAGDTGQHEGCCTPGAWQATGGSLGVFINGKPAFRSGDETLHTGGTGELVAGSPDVSLGEAGSGTPKERPHDVTVALDVSDALGRPVHDVTVSIFCPHQQHEDRQIDGATSIGGLCTGATVTVRKALQVGTWDEGASQPAAPHHHATHHVGTGSAAATGGAAAPSGSANVTTTVHAPAPASTPSEHNLVHLVRPNGGTTVRLPTVHNWIELVYRAFGHGVSHAPRELTLLGVREASLEGAKPHVPVDTLEKEADAGDLADLDFTREHKAPAYNDLLFCLWTDKNVHSRQHVEVFECTIDASPGKGLLHLPFLLEGHLFHARPGPFKKRFPGHDVTLHVFEGTHEHHAPPAITADKVLAVARKERGTIEAPVNRQKYGAWYGANGVYWCAQFVSWVFAHAGMPLIHYEGCSDGAAHFQSGAWGTWHGGSGAHAEPGDVVFYDFPGEARYDHTGIVVEDHGSYLTTIEGNTSPQSGGSQSNGGGVYQKTRPKDSTVIGFGRPRFQKPHPEPVSFIRWGGEGAHVNPQSSLGSTLLHHHYFKPDHHGQEHPDPAATRYRRFMQVYNGAPNKAHIPYLVVSSRYLQTYSEWAAWVGAHPGVTPGPKSVILEKGLQSPGGHAHHYLPSFLGKNYADRVLAHARAMHDHHKAEQLRAALMGCLMKLSI